MRFEHASQAKNLANILRRPLGDKYASVRLRYQKSLFHKLCQSIPNRRPTYIEFGRYIMFFQLHSGCVVSRHESLAQFGIKAIACFHMFLNPHRDMRPVMVPVSCVRD